MLDRVATHCAGEDKTNEAVILTHASFSRVPIVNKRRPRRTPHGVTSLTLYRAERLLGAAQRQAAELDLQEKDKATAKERLFQSVDRVVYEELDRLSRASLNLTAEVWRAQQALIDRYR